jgi:hypothetical protein
MDGRTATDTEVLRALGEDPRLAKLEDHVSSLSLFRTFGVDRDEVAHSRVLAALLDPHRHQGAEAMLRALIGKVLEDGGLNRGLEGQLGEVARASWQGVTVRREHFFIDVVVEISSSRGAAVVGIVEQDRRGGGGAADRALPGGAAARLPRPSRLGRLLDTQWARADHRRPP